MILQLWVEKHSFLLFSIHTCFSIPIEHTGVWISSTSYFFSFLFTITSTFVSFRFLGVILSLYHNLQWSSISRNIQISFGRIWNLFIKDFKEIILLICIMAFEYDSWFCPSDISFYITHSSQVNYEKYSNTMYFGAISTLLNIETIIHPIPITPISSFPSSIQVSVEPSFLRFCGSKIKLSTFFHSKTHTIPRMKKLFF